MHHELLQYCSVHLALPLMTLYMVRCTKALQSESRILKADITKAAVP